jgi:alpha-L-rhamnosidase
MKRLFVLIVFLVHFTCIFAQKMQVVNLTCDNRKDPLGIEQRNPVLGWQIATSQKSVLQSAYRIIVSDNQQSLLNNTGNIWDSQKINSEQSIRVKYSGKQLEPAKTYYWKVQVWINKNQSSWSAPASWQMGLLSQGDWKGAKWIAYEAMPDSLRVVPAEHGRGDAKWSSVKTVLPLLRKTVLIPRPIRSATAFVCGLGHFELSINGKKVGNNFLDPGWTQYDKEAQYVVLDVTHELNQRVNAIGVMLGNGFYFIPRQRYRKLTGAFGFPKMIMRLQVEYIDGTFDNFVSNQSWRTAPSPITFSSIYGGEDYNATLEQPGWDGPYFDDVNWKPAIVVDGPPRLYAQLSPLKVHETFTPLRSVEINRSAHVFDLGQNASGIPQVTVKGKKGDTVRMVPAELLKEDGTANQRATGSPVYFDYVLKGSGVETWQPRFSYYGFRYLQVERAVLAGRANTDNLPVLIDVKGLHTRNAVERTGSFTTSAPLFNQIYSLIDWSVKSNMASVLTDCPHREKLGWLEQTHLMGNSIRYNYDMSAFFRKTVRDMMTAQSNSDVVPEYAPEFVKMPFMDSIFMDSPEWGSASIILPWYLYQWYGDDQTLQDAYGMMQRYIHHLKKRSKDNIVAYGLSDWYDLGPNKPGLSQLTPMGITATAIYYYDLQLMTKIASLLNKNDDAKIYSELAVEVRDAFNKKFFDKITMQYGSGSQTANAVAVHLGLVEPQYKQAVIENIIKDIRAKDNSLTAGDVGFRYLLKTLDEAGRSDVVFDMNSRTDVPGYGYQLVHGATALTESWQALPSVSNNHLMLGHLMEWFYTALAGISQPDSSIAFKQIVIRPQFVGNITSAKASYASPYGLIRSEWNKKEGVFELEVEIPANTTAKIILPGSDVIEVGSGIHTFKTKK